MSEREFTITKLRRDPEGGYWRARISNNGTTYDVDRRFGSWQIEARSAPRSRTMVRREVTAKAARALQATVIPIEKRERRAAA